MSSKKIFAAAMAAALATTSVAAVASAETPANDDWTWTIGNKTQKYIKSVDLKVLSEGLDIKNVADEVVNSTDNTKNSYYEMKFGVWEAFKNFNITELKSGKLTTKVTGAIEEWEEPYVLQTTSSSGQFGYSYVPYSQSDVGKATGYKPLVRKLKDGKKIVLNNSNLDKDGNKATTADDAVSRILAKALGTSNDPNQDISLADFITIATNTATYGTDPAVFVWDGKTAPTQGYTVSTTTGAVTDGSNVSVPGADPTAEGADSDASSYILTTAGKGGLTGLAGTAATDVLDVNVALHEPGTAYPNSLVQDLVKVTKTSENEIGKVFNDANGPVKPGFASGTDVSDHGGSATAPVTVKVEFDLDRAHKLQNVTAATATVELDMTIDGDTWKKFGSGNTSVGNVDFWGWVDEYFGSTGAGDFRDDLNKVGLALVGNSTLHPSTNNVAVAVKANLTEKENIVEDKKPLYLTKKGTMYIDFGTSVSPTFMKNLNNGGTVTFNLDSDATPVKYLTGYVLYWNGNTRVPLAGANAGYVVNGNSITFTVPEGLTYDEGTTNEWKGFNLQWVLEGNDDLIHDDRDDDYDIWEDDNGNDATPDEETLPKLRILSMTFKANGAPADGNTSGSTSGGSTSNGSNNGGNKNPSTGIALAVAPAALACAFVAVAAVKSKKK